MLLNTAADMGKLLSFLFLGTFHWHRYEVTGITSSSLSDRTVWTVAGHGWELAVVMATSACNTAETCVQLADFLFKKKHRNYHSLTLS